MHKVLISIGAFLSKAVEGIENFFKNTFAEIGHILSGAKTDIQPLFDALLAEIKALSKQALNDAIATLIAAGKLLLTDLIASL